MKIRFKKNNMYKGGGFFYNPHSDTTVWGSEGTIFVGRRKKGRTFAGQVISVNIKDLEYVITRVKADDL